MSSAAGSNRIRIHGGRVIDPSNDIDALQDVYLADGRIAAIGAMADTALRPAFVS